MAQHIDELFEEESDAIIQTVIVGEDGVTPIDSDIVTDLHMWMRDKEADPEVFLVDGRDVLSQLGPDGLLRLEMEADDMVATVGGGEKQLRLITLRFQHSGGKVKYEEITFYLDAMQDAPQPPLP